MEPPSASGEGALGFDGWAEPEKVHEWRSPPLAESRMEAELEERSNVEDRELASMLPHALHRLPQLLWPELPESSGKEDKDIRESPNRHFPSFPEGRAQRLPIFSEGE